MSYILQGRDVGGAVAMSGGDNEVGEVSGGTGESYILPWLTAGEQQDCVAESATDGLDTDIIAATGSCRCARGERAQLCGNGDNAPSACVHKNAYSLTERTEASRALTT